MLDSKEKRSRLSRFVHSNRIVLCDLNRMVCIVRCLIHLFFSSMVWEWVDARMYVSSKWKCAEWASMHFNCLCVCVSVFYLFFLFLILLMSQNSCSNLRLIFKHFWHFFTFFHLSTLHDIHSLIYFFSSFLVFFSSFASYLFCYFVLFD